MSEASASGPKLTINESGASDAVLTPTEQMVRGAIKAETLTYTKDDGTPGSLGVRRPDALAQFRILEAAGPTAAMNSAYMQMINPIVYVGSLDGVPEALPSTHGEIEGLLQRLGWAGQEVLFDWYGRNIIQPMVDAADAAAKMSRDQLAIKN